MTKTYYSHGKLLLSGEYLVLMGARAFAIPLKLGQTLTVKTTPADRTLVSWKAFDEKNQNWLTVGYTGQKLLFDGPCTDKLILQLRRILMEAKRLDPDFLSQKMKFEVETHLDFNLNWGMGSSSTLVANIAEWAGVNPYQLAANSFGGSGYDIACAIHHSAIFFQLTNEVAAPSITPANFNPSFHDKLFFVYTGKKKNSRESIAAFKEKDNILPADIYHLSKLSDEIASAENIEDFTSAVQEHESFLAKKLGLPTAKDALFSTLQGNAKWLGAWGGDFVLYLSQLPEHETKTLLLNEGFETFFRYKDVALDQKFSVKQE